MCGLTGGGEGGPVVSLTVGASDPAPFQTGRQVRLGRLLEPATSAATCPSWANLDP
jgi:hypothetical protein